MVHWSPLGLQLLFETACLGRSCHFSVVIINEALGPQGPTENLAHSRDALINMK